MSAATTRPAPLRAELLTWKRSLPHQLVYVVSVYGILLTAALLFSGMNRDWNVLLNWDNVWAVTVGPLYAILLGASITALELRHRGGGTWWRRIDPTTARASRTAVLILHIVAANVLALFIPLLGGIVAGFPGAVPWQDTLMLALVCGLSQSALAVMTTVLARVVNPGVAFAVGAVFAMSRMFAGTVETERWMQWPANWLVRGTLPFTHTHANGVGLAPGDPLLDVSPWAPAALSLALAAVLSSFDPAMLRRGMATWRGRRGSAGSAAHATNPVTSSPVQTDEDTVRTEPAAEHVPTMRRADIRPAVSMALSTVVLRTSVPWIPIGLFVVGLTALRWRPALEVAQLIAVVVVPITASVLPIMLWSTLHPGWRAICARPTRSMLPMRILVVGAVSALSLLTGLAYGLLVTRGLDTDVALRAWFNCLVVASFVIPVVMWTTTRFGVAVAGAVSIFGIIFGALIGATGLMVTLWPLMPWAWGSLSGLPRVAAAATVTAILAPVVTALAGKAAVARATAES